MNIQKIIWQLTQLQDLSAGEMQSVMQEIFAGNIQEMQLADFLLALHAKGESVTELTSAVKVMRSLAKAVIHSKPNLIDIVGTGGDAQHTFNISTACSFVVAAAGGAVAKHGNRSSSSSSGAADVLECAGVNLARSAELFNQTVDNFGVGFLFAPIYHSAMAQVAAVRKKLAVRTVFNLIGPLTNPASAKFHLIGVYAEKWLQPFAEVLKNLGATKALIVYGADGLDEITIATSTKVVELNQQAILQYEITPEQFGVERQSLSLIKVNNPAESLKMIFSVFENKPSAARDIVVLNSAAALYAADLTNSIEAGIEQVKILLASGRVLQLFNRFIQATK